jgi:hypothetical protein
MDEAAKKAAIAALKQKELELSKESMYEICFLADATPKFLAECGYKDFETAVMKVVKNHRAEVVKIMKPFDRGDFD